MLHRDTKAEYHPLVISMSCSLFCLLINVLTNFQIKLLRYNLLLNSVQYELRFKISRSVEKKEKKAS
ncbi:hypothetical protein T12_14634 [Trichinella patagoniensis]|uniref:Uncharacterized protein n=1 Tax=Trichinella patagoniensis TaxID=990121 RepID=A0A0V0Z7P9_9BILA|nr:hypothetical protein T12_14634 [Trichinella patagoniensis]